MKEEINPGEMTDPLVRLFADKLEQDARNHVLIKRRVDLIVWVAIGLLLLAALTVVLRSINYYELRVQVDAKSEQLAKLTEANTDLTKRVNKLRAEVALRDARFQASKGIAQKGGRIEELLTVQAIIDRYALEHLRNGDSEGKTADDVRREVCHELEQAGYPCLP